MSGGRRLSRDWGKRSSVDGSAWWHQRARSTSDPPSQPALKRASTGPVTQDNYYSWPHAQTSLGSPVAQAQAPPPQPSGVPPLERSTSANDSGYHDSASEQQAVSSYTSEKVVRSGDGFQNGDSKSIARQRELEAVKEAVRRSRLDDEAERNRVRRKLGLSVVTGCSPFPPVVQREQEELMLQAAIAESQRLAEIANSAREQGDAREAQAVLESRRQSLHNTLPVAHAPPPPPSSWPEPGSAPASSSSHDHSLESSEMLLRSRNEKGGLWTEAGAHGWLPPGASWGAQTAEEAREAAMLERAIKASLEEERVRSSAEWQSRRDLNTAAELGRANSGTGQPARTLSHISVEAAPAPPELFDGNSKMFRNTVTPATFQLDTGPPKVQATRTALLPLVTSPLSPPTSPEMRDKPRQLPKTAELPPYAESDPSSPATNPQSPLTISPPTSPRLGAEAPLSPRPLSVTEMRSPWDAHRAGASGSPFDLPFLLSSTSLHSLSPTAERPLSSDFATANDVTSPQSRTQASSKDGSATQQLDGSSGEGFHSDSTIVESLMVRNPDTLEPRTEPGTDSLRISRPSLPAPIFTGTTRTLSLVSERTEPPSPTSKASILTKVSGASGDTEYGTQAVVEPTRLGSSKLRDQVASASSEGHAGEGEEEEGGEEENVVESPNDYIEEGVRFGFVERVLGEDGKEMLKGKMGRDASFPTAVTLSSMSNNLVEYPKLGFVLEAASWTQLLRSLMWFGDSTITASSHDTAAMAPGRCEASLSLSFDKLDSGDLVVRLTVALSSVASTDEHAELRLLGSATSDVDALRDSESKGKARATSFERAVFVLPDRIVLPARLSQMAISLHSLRHVAQIAISTVPAPDATAEFFALRTLALKIKALSVASASALTETQAGPSTSNPIGTCRRGSEEPEHLDHNPELDTLAQPEARTNMVQNISRASTAKHHSNSDLVERIKSRLRRLKTGSAATSPSSPLAPAMSPVSLKSNAADSGGVSITSFSASTDAHDYSSLVQPHAQPSRLTKPARTTVVRRRDRILLNEEDDHENFQSDRDEYETLVDSEGRSVSVHDTPRTRSRSHSASQISLPV
ncbi:hypothetical protein OIV83_002632 [Microbotryomycetes sp. JL201]|nr:hypothetical protein OIV83_002632 [Microbotryomycetes sp. JL201]